VGRAARPVLGGSDSFSHGFSRVGGPEVPGPPLHGSLGWLLRTRLGWVVVRARRSYIGLDWILGVRTGVPPFFHALSAEKDCTEPNA
jgi:hypothetical protein